ncbi:MAG: hypothetical protein KF897_05530 [Opitutaceae bacterium]|nr:hypothetical protein [Opitutaceae bacterium]
MSLRYHAAGFLHWLRLLRRHGRPERVLHFNGGIGDQLLCSAVAREISRRGGTGLWLATTHPELFRDNPDVELAFPASLDLVPWFRLAGTPIEPVRYAETVFAEDRDVPPTEPIIAALCRSAGLHGSVILRPWLPAVRRAVLTPRARQRVAVQSSVLTARYPMPNKQWPAERWQAVAMTLTPQVELVQVGSPSDPRIEGAEDRRQPALLATAAVLADCDLFAGPVGFLMHLARAVDCPAVIVYGGREPPAISGYACNTNLATAPACSPCWQYTRCDHARRCLMDIPAAAVSAAISTALKRAPARPLPAETYELN